MPLSLVTAPAVLLVIEQLRAAEGARARPARPVLQGVPFIKALMPRQRSQGHWSGSGSGSSPLVTEELLLGVLSRGLGGGAVAALLLLLHIYEVGVSHRQHDHI
jgi:hypothetical protein